MPIPVKLGDVVTEMDVPNDEWTVYLDRRTGEMVTVTPEDEALLEDPGELEDAPAWQAEQLPRIREALASDDYLALPGKFEIHEWSIVERFVRSVDDHELRDRLDRAIHGRGAFRRFRGVLRDVDRLDEWYGFRERALEEIAAGWLEANGIPFERGSGGR